MAHDIFLGETNTSWSRGGSIIDVGYNGHWKFMRGEIADEVTLSFTEDEKAMLDKLATTQNKAAGGDTTARKQLQKFKIDLVSLKSQAKKGDPKARRTLLVLHERGVFNQPQRLDITGALFKDDPHAKDRQAVKWEDEVNKISSQDQIENLGKLIAFNPEYKQHTLDLAGKGNTTARKILDSSEKYSAGTTTHLVLPKLVRGKIADSSGDDVDPKVRLRIALRQLNQKSPKTEDDRRAIETLTERLTRLEAMSGSFVGAFVGRENRSQRRARRQQKLTSLKTRAAAGDQAAIARLQKMQSRLTTELSTINTPGVATATPVVNPYAPTTPYGTSAVSPSYTPTNPVAPATYPPAYPAAYPAYPPQYAYQSPYYDPSQDPYSPYSQPTIDVYQGSATQGDEEAAALAGDGGSVERAALRRTGRMSGSFVGLEIPNSTYRATIQKYARRQANGKQPATKDIFLAKAAVDRAIGKAGITLYMPGAQPGRRTI